MYLNEYHRMSLYSISPQSFLLGAIVLNIYVFITTLLKKTPLEDFGTPELPLVKMSRNIFPFTG